MEACQELGEQRTQGQPRLGAGGTSGHAAARAIPRGRALRVFARPREHICFGDGFHKGAGRRSVLTRFNRLDARARTATARALKVHRAVRNVHFSEKVSRLYLDDCSAELSFCLFAIGGARVTPGRGIRRTRTFHESLSRHPRATAVAGLPTAANRTAIRASSKGRTAPRYARRPRLPCEAKRWTSPSWCRSGPAARRRATARASPPFYC